MKHLSDILFLDIETAGVVADFDSLDDRGKNLWKIRAGHLLKQDHPDEQAISALFRQRAAIYAEFGRVVNISMGCLQLSDHGPRLRLRSLGSTDEFQILSSFSKVMDEYFYDPEKHILCGHNIREFDIPYLCRRMTSLGISPPSLLQIAGKKPWQVTYLYDTFEYWKFGDFKTYTSLDLLAYSLNIPSPKSELDGSKVHETYWIEADMDAISRYCEMDVITVVQIFMKLSHLPTIPDDHIFISTKDDLDTLAGG